MKEVDITPQSPSVAMIKQIIDARLTLLSAGLQDIIAKKHSSKAYAFKSSQHKTISILAIGKKTAASSNDCFLFQDALIQIGKKELRGTIQLNWKYSAALPEVLLQICYLPAEKNPLKKPLEKPLEKPLIPLIVLKELLKERLYWAEDPSKAPVHELPGPCGVIAAGNPKELNSLIHHAAEARVSLKSNIIIKPLRHSISDPNDSSVQPQLNQKLFETIACFISVKSYQESFLALAKYFPFSEMGQFLSLSPEKAKLQVLARWMGALHILNDPPSLVHQDCREYYSELQDIWQKLGITSPLKQIKRVQTRPLNSVERRLTALFWHIYNLQPHGLLNGWLRILSQIDSLDESMQSEIKSLLKLAFHTPNSEPWQLHTTFRAKMLSQPTQLAGEHMVAVLAANAIVPFFLGLARWKRDIAMEKTLYRFYLLLPTELSNPRIKYMEKRLFLRPTTRRPLRNQEGILQLQQNFCQYFPDKCNLCKIPILKANEAQSPLTNYSDHDLYHINNQLIQEDFLEDSL